MRSLVFSFFWSFTAGAAAPPCVAPSDQEVAAAKATLSDFVAIRSIGNDLVAAPLTPGELDDVAYFFVAADLAHQPPTVADRLGDFMQPGPPNAEREQLWQAMQATEVTAERARLGRAYLATLGYPGPIRGEEEDVYAWGGPRYAMIMRSLAGAVEELGNEQEAEELYRRAPVAGGPCGTSIGHFASVQREANIRLAGRARGCRATVIERLQVSRHDLGTDRAAPLKEAGFDITRLHRAALVTAYRAIGTEAFKAVLTKAPETLRAAAQRRLEQRGLEHWFDDTGFTAWAVGNRRGAIPKLLEISRARSRDDAVSTGLRFLREEALYTLSGVVYRPDTDPCARDEITVDGVTYSTHHLNIFDLELGLSECGETLAKPERDALAAQVMPLLRDDDLSIRTLAATVLGAIGSISAIPALLPFENDSVKQGDICHGEAGTDCTPHYPLRNAAKAALVRLRAFKGSVVVP